MNRISVLHPEQTIMGTKKKNLSRNLSWEMFSNKFHLCEHLAKKK